MTHPLFVSFSGGLTSAYMTLMLIRDPNNPRPMVIFCNTGQEDERTLDFVHRCDTRLGFNTVWLEAVFHVGRKGTTHRHVTYETATRDGRLFDSMCAKYGLPNRAYPHCTRELKLRPFYSFLHNELKVYDYRVAVGIRADEIDRMGSDPKIVYPLVNWGVKKSWLKNFRDLAGFTLEVPEHRGNCVWCWKKTDRKLRQVYQETPEAFAVPFALERYYAPVKGDPRVMGRKNRRMSEIIATVSGDDDDAPNGCSESCEVFGGQP